jgi:hypothetical protein
LNPQQTGLRPGDPLDARLEGGRIVLTPCKIRSKGEHHPRSCCRLSGPERRSKRACYRQQTSARNLIRFPMRFLVDGNALTFGARH